MSVESAQKMTAAGRTYIDLVDRAIELGIQAGVRQGIEAYTQQIAIARRHRIDKRLHNTKILLQNYRQLKAHVEGAVADAEAIKEAANIQRKKPRSYHMQEATSILVDLEESDLQEHVYVDAIRQSQQRTITILAHIDNILAIYRAMAMQDIDGDHWLRFTIIHERFIADRPKTPKELSGELNVDISSVYRFTDTAIEDLTAMLFGIDALEF